MSRPPLRVVDGLRDEIADQRMRDKVRADEARAHVRRMRMCMQTRFWTDPEFRAFAQPLLREIDRYAEQVGEPEKVA